MMKSTGRVFTCDCGRHQHGEELALPLKCSDPSQGSKPNPRAEKRSVEIWDQTFIIFRVLDPRNLKTQ